MDRYGQPTQYQLHGDVSAHMQIIVKKNLAREKFCFDSFSFLLTENENEQRHSVPGICEVIFSQLGKNVSLPEKFFLGLFSRLNGNG